jgi:predicted transcriptional regulator
MTRIGVMKHLRILEQAGLITTRKVGRERLHYLNSAPLRVVVDWIEQYRRHWDERMDRLEDYLRELQQTEQQANPQLNSETEETSK